METLPSLWLRRAAGCGAPLWEAEEQGGGLALPWAIKYLCLLPLAQYLQTVITIAVLQYSKYCNIYYSIYRQ